MQVEHTIKESDRVFGKLHLVSRWFVPLIYAFFFTCFLLDVWRDCQRLNLANDISRVIKYEKPKVLTQLKATLDSHIRNIHRTYSSTSDLSNDKVIIGLKPRVRLHLSVELQPESEYIKDIILVYANSEQISLDNPEEDLHEFPSWYEWLFVFLGTIIPSIVWLHVSKKQRLKSFWQIIIAFFAALPLLILLPLSIIILFSNLLL
jgi:hypothetical protein